MGDNASMKNNEWIVVNENGQEVTLPALLKDFRGDFQTVTAISRLPFEASEGRVVTEEGRELYPKVFNLKIVKR